MQRQVRGLGRGRGGEGSEGPPFRGELTSNTQEQKDAGARGGPPPGSGGKCSASLRRPPLPGSPPMLFPTHPASSCTCLSACLPNGTGGSDHLPPSHLVSLPSGSSMCLCCQRFNLSVSLLSVHLPVYSLICQPPCHSTLRLSLWLLNHPSCCPAGPPPPVRLPQTGSWHTFSRPMQFPG